MDLVSTIRGVGHLSSQGKAGIIVPEGVIFQSTNAHKQLRQKLVDAGLWCVVSLPAGVFQPYSGVKTSILLIDKTLASKFNRIMFIKINSDGFDLTANRRPILQNDLPNATKLVQYCKKEIEAGHIRDNYYFPFDDEDHSISIAPLTYSFEKVDRINEESDITLNSSRYDRKEITENQRWPLVRIGDVFKTSSGGTPSKSNNEYYDGVIPWLGSGEIAKGHIKSSKNHISESGLKNSSAKLFPVNSVLIAMYGATVGQVGILDFESTTNQAVCAIFPKEDVAIPEYVYLLLKSYRAEFIKLSVGGAQPNISQTLIKDLEIPLPPIDIQRKIAHEIGGYQKTIDSARYIVNNYRPSIKTDEAWSVKALGDVSTFVRGPFGGSLKKDIFTDSGYAVYEQFNAIQDNFKRIRYFINQSKFDQMKRFELKPDDLIISCSGTMGRIAVAPQGLTPGIINQALLKLTPNTDVVLSEYLRRALETEEIQSKYFTDQAGSGIPNVPGVEILKGIPIPIPSLKAQNDIVEVLKDELKLIEANKTLIEIYKQKIKSVIDKVWD